MQVRVRGSQCTHVLDVTTPHECVATLCQRLATLENVRDETAARLTLSRAGAVLPDEALISDLATDVGEFEFNVGLLGGKVHGSLARAGKVKGQTPKVAKQEDKRKKKVGRAKARERYHRRMKVVVPTMGKKKGPNANS